MVLDFQYFNAVDPPPVNGTRLEDRDNVMACTESDAIPLTQVYRNLVLRTCDFTRVSNRDVFDACGGT